MNNLAVKLTTSGGSESVQVRAETIQALSVYSTHGWRSIPFLTLQKKLTLNPTELCLREAKLPMSNIIKKLVGQLNDADTTWESVEALTKLFANGSFIYPAVQEKKLNVC